ncbi:hypothetical protein, partial [Mycoplasma elephantis]|uniref:hypothetical protein n=1 Tax=Mycoplasma elephantis TaxID=114882 RepID=UPI000563A8AD
LNLKLEVYKNLSLSTKVTKEFIVPINGFLSLDKLNENRVNNYISNINKQALNTINFKNNLASKAKYNNSDELISDTGNYLKSYIDIDANKYKKYNIGNIEIRLDNARHVIDNDLKASKTIYLVAKCGNYEKQFSVIVNGYLENKVKDDDIKFVKDNVFVNLANSGKFQDDMWHGVNPNEVKLNDVKLIKKGGAAFDTNKYELKPTKVEMAHAPSSDGGPGKSVITYTLRVKYFDTWTEAQNQKVEVKCRNNRKELEDLLKNSDIEPIINPIARDGISEPSMQRMFAHTTNYYDNKYTKDDSWFIQYNRTADIVNGPNTLCPPGSNQKSQGWWMNKINFGFSYLRTAYITDSYINEHFSKFNIFENIDKKDITNITENKFKLYQKPEDPLTPENISPNKRKYPKIYKTDSGEHDMTYGSYFYLKTSNRLKYKEIERMSVQDFFKEYIDPQLYLMSTKMWIAEKINYKFIDSAIKNIPNVYLVDEDVVLKEKSWFNNYIISIIERDFFAHYGGTHPELTGVNTNNNYSKFTWVWSEDKYRGDYSPWEFEFRPDVEKSINIPTVILEDANFPLKNRLKVFNNVTYKNVDYKVEMVSLPMVFKNSIKTDLEKWRFGDRTITREFYKSTNLYLASLRSKQPKEIWAYQGEVWYDFNYDDDNRISVEFK